MIEKMIHTRKVAGIDDIQEVLTGSKILNIDYMGDDNDPDAIILEVRTASGETQYIEFGTDEGQTEKTLEEAEWNPFYTKIEGADWKDIQDLSIPELEKLRDHLVRRSCDLYKAAILTEKTEEKLFGVTPQAVYCKFYSKVYQVATHLIILEIKDRTTIGGIEKKHFEGFESYLLLAAYEWLRRRNWEGADEKERCCIPVNCRQFNS